MVVSISERKQEDRKRDISRVPLMFAVMALAVELSVRDMSEMYEELKLQIVPGRTSWKLVSSFR